MSICICAVLALVSCTCAASVIDDFEDGDRWTFHNGGEFPGAQGSFKLSPKAAHKGKMGGVLSFDFRNGGRYVQAGIPLPRDIECKGFKLFIRKPCSNSLGVRVTDSEGQTFQKIFNITHQEWQCVLVTMSQWQGSWGGKADGVFRGKPTHFAVLVENTSSEKTGKVYIDDVEAVSTGEHTEEATYTVTRFRTEEGWGLWVSGTMGKSLLKDGELHFDFSGANEVGLRNEIALLGSPQSLILSMSSRTRGYEVVVRILSHFQVFEKVIGELNGEGSQTFEASLGGMSEWTHYGGENDGVARWPLRLWSIALRRKEGPAVGDVVFESLKVRTKPGSQGGIALIPRSAFENGEVRFSCELISILSSRVTGELQWTIRDFGGFALQSGKTSLSIGTGETVRFERLFTQKVLPFAECEFEYRALGRVFGPVSVTAVSPLVGSGEPKLEPDSIFGMGVYLYRYLGSPEGLARMEKAAQMASNAGVKWSREEFGWARIEPERGQYNWTFYDEMVDTALRNGISIYGLISYWSSWTKPNTPEGIADYANYCRSLVSRYKGKIRHWEVWNEPNIFFWTGPREMYADLLKAAYAAIKEADAEAEVLGCSTSGIDSDFIKMVMDSGAPFDALTIHPYRQFLRDESFIRELQEAYELTARDGGRGKPVWITEMGWATDIPNGVTEREQASLLSRVYLCAAASGVVRNVSWYDFRDDGNCPFYGEHRFGILRNDLSPKPAYRALSAVTSAIGNKKLRRALDLGQGILAYEFSGESESTIAIWPLGNDVILPIKIEGKSARLCDLMLSEKPLTSREILALKAGVPIFIIGERLTISPDGAPVFVERPASGPPGRQLRIVLRGSEGRTDLTFRLEYPQRWKVTKEKDGFSLTIPSLESLATKDLKLIVRCGRRTLVLPMSVRISPEVMWV